MGTHHEICLARWRLQEREKHRRLLIFGNDCVFSVFHHTHDLNTRSILQLVIAADSVADRTEHLTGKVAVHDRNREVHFCRHAR